MWGITNPYQHKVIAAMEDYNRVLDATTVSENANGTAAEKMTIYTQTLEAAQNNLTSSIQQFAQDSNLDQILIAAYNGLAKVVDILNILLNKIPVLSPLIKAMGVALATAFAGATIKNMISTSEMLKGIVSAAPGVVSAFANMAAGAGTFGAVVEAAGGPVTIILSALAAIIAIAPAVASAWQKIFPSAEKKAEEAKNALDESNTELAETKTKIEDVQKQIDEINSKDKLTLADETERDRLQEQLDLLEKIRENQEKINEQKKEEALKTEQAKVDEMTGYDAEAASPDNVMLDYEKNLESEDVNTLIASYKSLADAKKELNSADKDYAEQVKENEDLASQFSTKLLEQKQAALEEMQKLANLEDTSSEQYQKLQALVDAIDVTLDPSSFGKIKIADMLDDSGFDNVLSNLHDKAVSAVQKAGKDSSEEAQTQAKQAMNQLNGYITTEADKLAEQVMGDDTLKQQFAEWLNIDPNDINIDQLADAIKQKLQEAYGVATEAANTASNANTIYGTTLSDNSTLADELAQNETELGNKTKSLSDAYNAMNKNGKITKAQMTALIKDYPELASAIEVSNGAIKVNTEALKDQYKQIITTHNESIQAQIDDTKVVIEQTKQRILAYQAEIAALQTVQLTQSKFVDEAYDPETGAMVAGTSQSVEGKGGNRFGSAASIQAAIDASNKSLDDLLNRLDILQGAMHTDELSYTGTTSSSSSADKTFENEVKEKIKNLKAIVTLYSKQDNWSDPEVVENFTNDYEKLLNEVINDPKARKILADSFNLDISEMSDEDQIKNLTTLWKDQAGTIEETYEELAEKATKALKEASEAREKEYEEAVKNIQALQKMTVNMIETAIDLLEKAGDIVFDLLGKISDKYDKQIDALDDQMDNLDKIADNLDDQKDAFDDKIDAQKEMLKLQKEEMDNADELADKNKSIADIDAQLMELQYDNSAEAQAKRLKLLDERAQKEKDLSDYQKDQAYDTKVSALDREKAAYDANIEAQKKYVEAQKELLKEQQDALKDAQDKFNENLSNAQNAFNGFIKIISSDLFKNLAANILDSLDGETLHNILDAWNTWFGDGLKSTVDNTWNNAYKALTDGGWQKGDSVLDFLNIFQKGQQTESNIQSVLSDALNSGNIDFSSIKNTVDSMGKSFTDFAQNAIKSVMKVDNTTGGVLQNVLNLGKQALDTAANSSNGILSTLAKGIQTIAGTSNAGVVSVSNAGNGLIAKLASNGINSIQQMGITGNGVLSNLGGVAGNILNLFTQGIGGIAQTVVKGIGTVIGNVGSALGIGSAGTAAAGVASAGGLAGIGGALASAASVALPVAAIGAGVVGGIQSFKNIKNVWQDESASTLKKVATTAWNLSPIGIVGNAIGSVISGVGKLFGFHHNGADYVKKQHPELDRMLGLGDDETVSILKVGEAVVPTWANNATRSSSGHSYTGSPFGSAVDSAVKSARATVGSSTVSNSTDSSINISMPINIKGDADESTVKALKDATNNIVSTVLKTINGQTRLGGYRNIKAATV